MRRQYRHMHQLCTVNEEVSILMGRSGFDRDGGELEPRGLYLDMSPWGHQRV